MARVFGVELVILLTLGFSIGALTFQCWRGTRQLAAVQMDNEQLKASMQQTESRAKTAEYRRSLVQSDLEQLQVELDQKERTLNQQVTELRGQLVSYNPSVSLHLKILCSLTVDCFTSIGSDGICVTGNLWFVKS